MNDQFRICFVWRDGSAHEVEFVNPPLKGRPMTERLAPLHAGEVLRIEFMVTYGMSAGAVEGLPRASDAGRAHRP